VPDELLIVERRQLHDHIIIGAQIRNQRGFRITATKCPRERRDRHRGDRVRVCRTIPDDLQPIHRWEK